jgi:tight adherence protein C
MAATDYLIVIAVFITGTSLVYGVLHYANSRRVLKARFKKAPAVGIPLFRQTESSLKRRFLEWVSSFGKFAMANSENTAKLRSALIMAGFRHPKGTAIFFGIKALAAVILPLPVLLANIMNGHLTSGQMAFCLALAGAGFYLPQYILQLITRKRQDRIDRALPDVLDLLIVCVEAGLSLQSALNRLTEEVRNICMDMHNELHLTNAELRTGITREAALNNLGERTGVQNVKALVGMMIQSDKMGTSISQALRVHASFLRVQRAQKAEEVAAKLPVKIMFPMLFFIFPAVFIVVLGPAVIKMMRSSFFSTLRK